MVEIQRARVFISCGQRKDTEEIRLAKDIAVSLKDMGFEPYVAVEEQTLKGLKENVFARLAESEYLIFIDFSRERLFTAKEQGFEDTGENRGSLFSHQELAVASYLDLDIGAIAFQEVGNKEDDGILGFIQANCIQFSDRAALPNLITEEVRKQKWDPNWRNELRLERTSSDRDDNVRDVPVEKTGSYFHIKVRNLHRSKVARDCLAYLERWVNLSTNQESRRDLVEFKWKGVTTVGVAIPPRSFRRFDAFCVYYDSPSQVNLGLNRFVVDFGGYLQQYILNGPGQYRLSFVVFSSDFAPARATFLLTVGSTVGDISFNLIETSARPESPPTSSLRTPPPP